MLDPDAVLYGHRCPNGNTQRKVLRTGRRHQQSEEQPHATAPMPSTNRPMIAKSKYRPAARPTRRFMTPTYGDATTAATRSLARAPRLPRHRPFRSEAACSRSTPTRVCSRLTASALMSGIRTAPSWVNQRRHAVVAAHHHRVGELATRHLDLDAVSDSLNVAHRFLPRLCSSKPYDDTTARDFGRRANLTVQCAVSSK